ncbi:MAG: DUF362 domain-containing protein [Ignavibacteriaceae bacterium]|nr:DUF362 domain-containing protein [Ignavibacteriaceae bacterium]
MDRRDFLKKSVFLGATAGLAGSLGSLTNVLANTKFYSPKSYDLVAIKGGEPAVMFDKAMESFGGMKSFVKKGQSVVIKPNIGWDVTPERGGDTNPQLVKQIIKHCLNAGAKDVYVFDHTCDYWKKCYSNSGIEKAVNDAGGKIVSGESEGYYNDVQVKSGSTLKNAKVHELILNSDVFINVPVLKHHSSSGITIGMKNLMGVVWDRRFWHQNNLQQCIADFASYRKPNLTIVDAYNVMKRNGPRGVSKEDLITMKSLIISRDLVAADAAAAKLFGTDPEKVDYIRIANEMKLGVMDLNKLSINRIIM